MYKEYRNVSRTLAVESLYQDMAARHRARFRSIHVFAPSSLVAFLFLSLLRNSLIKFRLFELSRSQRRKMSNVLIFDNCLSRT